MKHCSTASQRAVVVSELIAQQGQYGLVGNGVLQQVRTESWQTFAKIASHFEPTDLARLEALFSKARLVGLLRPDLDVVVMVVLVEQICWSAPAALPLYQSLLAGRNFSSATALTHVREQVIDLLVAGIMSDPGDENTGGRR